MKLLPRTRDDALADRLVWQSASLLLCYPDERSAERLDTVERLLAYTTGRGADHLRATIATLRASDPLAAASDYVETFDMHRHATMYLTYWTAGDTRNRGTQMLAFTRAYQDAGVTPPQKEAPDFLPVVLEFAATVHPESGRRLLVEYRVSIDVLHDALREAGSPYSHTVAAVCETLPPASSQEVLHAQKLAEAGPPKEAVGLQPFTLTVPPRRGEAG